MMQRSTDRILTTHTGSLPRLPVLLEAMRAREEAKLADEPAFQAAVSAEVSSALRRWLATRDGSEFFAVLNEALSAACGEAVQIDAFA